MSKAIVESLPPQITPTEFSKIIAEKAKERSTSIFKNGSPANANIVAANIFKHSTTIRIYADNMDGKISDCLDDYYNELTIFLNRPETKLDLILDKAEEKKSKSLTKILKTRHLDAKKVSISIASPGFTKAINQMNVAAPHEIHFMTGDGDKFRLEYNKETKSAYFSFNNLDITQKLIEVFDENIENCPSL